MPSRSGFTPAERGFEMAKITKSSVTDELIRGAKLWLAESKKMDEEKKKYKVTDYRYQNREDDALRYRSMSQALYLCGKHLGVVFPDEIETTFKVSTAAE